MLLSIRHCVTVSIVASLRGHPIATISSSKVQTLISPEVQRKCQRQRIVEMPLRITSALTVVCIILNNYCGR